jgi:hypothetical protein
MNDQFTVTPTLGDFFAIWGEPLSTSQVWNFSGQVRATMWDTNTGTSTSFSNDPGNLPLYRPPGGPTSNPYAIPQNLIFNGAYGDGASGGTFDGEIIWLNVSGATSAFQPIDPACDCPGLMSGAVRSLTEPARSMVRGQTDCPAERINESLGNPRLPIGCTTFRILRLVATSVMPALRATRA